ncbi:uncharacterized protein LOC115706184 isoform X2 [Cannabis sativa]|uniref:uncharacterized protein LOC115706184 isoform X2 n=1 Tax=Cannabis sativa TaxID=3483 RepID=UPI0029CA6490|nr:uncharacterized protein LOC115706184 isoform X2 [Cannabis sativa]
MTVDDERSIYIGGIPYDASDESIRRVVDVYGAVDAVKIVNDRGTRGKCYAFVTFTNPRSVIDAIKCMDGKTIDGRVVRVNGVRTRGGRTNFGRDSFLQNFESGREWGRGRVRDRDRDKERDYDRDRRQYHDRSSRERDRSQDYDLQRERDHDFERAKGSFLDRDRVQDRDLVDNDREDWEKDRDFNFYRKRDIDRANGHDTFVEIDAFLKLNGSTEADRHSKEFVSDINDDQLEEQLYRSSQRLEELNKEILQLEDNLEENEKSVLYLQQKSKKLEDALINVKKTSSYNKTQLTKLHKCFLLVQDYTERLKTREKQLQSLVDEVKTGGLCAGITANGNA